MADRDIPMAEAPAPEVNANQTPVRPVGQAHAPTPRTRPARSYAPRANPGPTNAPAPTGAPDLLRTVEGDEPLHVVQRETTSSYVPDSTNMYLILNAMDIQMQQTRRFYETTVTWHPLVSQLYYGNIFMLAIMRAQIEAGLADQYMVQFYNWFTSSINLSSLPIAGPLVPVFQALTNNSATFDNYGNVGPRLPRTCSAQEATCYGLQHGHAHVLPPIPLIMDKIQALFAAQNAAAFTAVTAAQWNFEDCSNHNIAPTAAAPPPVGPFTIGAAEQNAWAVTFGFNPTMASNVNVNPAVTLQFASNMNLLNAQLPARLAVAAVPAAVNMTYGDYMRLTVGNAIPSIEWFKTVMSVMTRHSQFFTGTTTFDKISSVGLGTSLFTHVPSSQGFYVQVAHYQAPIPPVVAAPPAPAAPGVRAWIRRFGNTNTTIQAVVRTADVDMPSLPAQYALVTGLNKDFAAPIAASPVQALLAYPTNATLRFGPFWDLRYELESVSRDFTAGLGANIQAHYHVDTRLGPKN